jgi:hypothetical protein
LELRKFDGTFVVAAEVDVAFADVPPIAHLNLCTFVGLPVVAVAVAIATASVVVGLQRQKKRWTAEAEEWIQGHRHHHHLTTEDNLLTRCR